MKVLKPNLIGKLLCFNEGVHDFKSSLSAMQDKTGFRAALAENIIREVINHYFKEKVELLMAEYLNDLKNSQNRCYYQDFVGENNGLLYFIIDLINENEKIAVEVKSCTTTNINYYLEQLNEDRINQFNNCGYDYILGVVYFNRNGNWGKVFLHKVSHNGVYFDRTKILRPMSFEIEHGKKEVLIKFEDFEKSFKILDILKTITKPIGEFNDNKIRLFTKKEMNSIYKINAYPHRKLTYYGD